MTNRRRSTLLAVLAMTAAATSSLVAQSALPARYRNEVVERADQWRRTQLPSRQRELRPLVEHRLEKFSAKEIAQLAEPGKSGLKRIGLHRDFTARPEMAGRWESQDLWRMSIRADQSAAGLRLHLKSFHIGSGSFWIHDGVGDGAQVAGPYSGHGIFGDGEFWTDTIFGDTLVIEYQPAAGAAGREELPFEIAEVSQLGAGLFGGSAKAGSPSAAASCNLDVTCYGDWAETAKAVGRYSFESGGSSYVCSGTLLNTTNDSRVPYFLTADHCISSEAEARSVNVYWAYQTPSCNGTPPNPRNLQRSVGSNYLGGIPSERGDGTLLKLTTVPSGVVFAGWTADTPDVGSNVTGIHHPAGDYKRISFGTLRNARTSRNADTFWGSFWEGGGLTEGGSSGSGLFLADGRLVGQLSHGPKYDSEAEYCAALPFADNYGKFSVIYPSIRSYLEGGTGGGTPPATGTGVLTSGVPAAFRIGPVTGGTLFAGDTGYRITVPEGATRLEIRLSTSTPSTDVDLFARFGQDVVVENRAAVADHRSTSDSGEESIVITSSTSPALRAGTYYIALGLYTANVTAEGTVVATITGGGGGGSTPPTQGTLLSSGAARNFSIGPVTGGTLFTGEFSYAIDVPQGATQLQIRVATSTANADVDVFARFGEAVTIVDRSAVYDHSSESATGNETITITPTSNPALRAGRYFIALALFTNNVTAQGTITATVTGGTPTTPGGDASGITLTSGQASRLTIQPVDGPTLMSGSNTFRIDVPANAQRLDIRLTAPGRNDVDLDLYVRHGQPTSLADGRPQADHSSTGDFADESVSITPTSNPALRAGTYYINIAVFTTGQTIEASVTATVVTASGGGGTGTPQTGSNVLTSGQSRPYNLPASDGTRLYRGDNGFVINVPQGATQLQVRLATPDPDVDVDLYVRGGVDCEIQNGRVVSDVSSTGNDGNELVTITGGALRPGAYYIAFVNFTPSRPASGTVTATISMANTPTTPPATAGQLQSGVPAQFRIGPVSSGTLFAGQSGYRVTVPQGATRLEIRVVTNTPNADVDLYSRFNQDVAIQDGTLLRDHMSDSLSGLETIVITPTTTPALRVGTYYIALGLFTDNVEANGTVTATVSLPGAPPAQTGAGTVLTSGTPAKFTFGPVQAPTLFNGNNSYRVVIPENATRLELRLFSETPSADTDLYLRHESDIAIEGSDIIADFTANSSLAHESITIDTPALKPGTYYVAIALYTRGAVARGSLLATIARTGVSGNEPVDITPVSDNGAELKKQKSGEEPAIRKERLKKVPVAVTE